MVKILSIEVKTKFKLVYPTLIVVLAYIIISSKFFVNLNKVTNLIVCQLVCSGEN